MYLNLTFQCYLEIHDIDMESCLMQLHVDETALFCHFRQSASHWSFVGGKTEQTAESNSGKLFSVPLPLVCLIITANMWRPVVQAQ